MLVTQSCLTLCNLTQQTRLLCPWNSPGKNIGVDSHAILQGIFPTQGSNFSLPHCRQILPSEPPEKPKIYANTIFNSIYTICNSWTVACQGPLSVSFFRQEYWSGLPFPSPWDHGVNSSHEVDKVLEFQLQHQSFQ